MRLFQDDCLSIEQYAQRIGKSRRTVQRYVSLGMPTISGTQKSIHLPTVNEWWLTKIESKPGTKETNND